MHIDLNSCFATIEQQANPLLRGKPIAIAAYDSPGGVILAPSIEAKTYGIKTGMRVSDGKRLFPSLIVKTSDPDKYRDVNKSLKKIISSYTSDFNPKSIDEFVLNLEKRPMLLQDKTLQSLGSEIKMRIKTEIGEWLTVSIGISTNRVLAKLASNIHKPDGLDEINSKNFLKVYEKLFLRDLNGIGLRNEARLNSVGIYTIIDFYSSPLWKLKSAFSSVLGYYWHTRLRGYEIDDFKTKRKTFGNSYALPKPFEEDKVLAPILAKLTEKMCFRLRNNGYKTQGIHLSKRFKSGKYWHKGAKTNRVLVDTREIYKEAYKLLLGSPKEPIHTLAVSCFNLIKNDSVQLDLLEDIEKKEKLVKAIDSINKRWGDFVITSARMMETKDCVHDRIAFGK